MVDQHRHARHHGEFRIEFSGTVSLYAIYATPTSDDQDFKVTNPSSTQLRVCAGCSSAYALRHYNSQYLAMDEESTLTVNSYSCSSQGCSSGYAYAFVTGKGIVFQVTQYALTGSCSGGGCTVVAVSGRPTSVNRWRAELLRAASIHPRWESKHSQDYMKGPRSFSCQLSSLSK